MIQGPLHYNVFQDELAEKGAREQAGFQRDISYDPFLISNGASEVIFNGGYFLIRCHQEIIY